MERITTPEIELQQVIDLEKELQNTRIAFETPKRWQNAKNLGEN